MISVMNKDTEFDRQSDVVNQENTRVSGAVIDSSNGESCVNLGVSGDVETSPMELDSVGQRSGGAEGDFRASVVERSEEACKARDGSLGKQMESCVLELKNENGITGRIDSGVNWFEGKIDGIDGQTDPVDLYINRFNEENEMNEQTERNLQVEKYSVSDYKSLLSEFDDYVANEKMITGTSRALSYGFEVGDMVWGKVKSHPWWPGHIFNEAFASPSVRRTRRPGHVLVAFFGDSSYGWFDPAELIPFDPHFAEKSQQTNSRNFVKAVEEAVDEASRRSGVGLVCRCRNPYNFRPTTVQGYFAVDVPDYEPGGVYSANQIKKARDDFLPNETLSFIKQLALAPQLSEQKSIDFIRNKAMVSALRKAVFEEFDETYAQAFGVQPSHTFHNSVNAQDQPYRQPPRAPLSGPLVIAETLGGGKSSKKPLKVKDNTKKDRYLFKRRDELSDLRTDLLGQVQATSPTAPAYLEGSSAEDYVLQKRVPVSQFPVKHEHTGFVSKDGADANTDGQGALIADLASAYSSVATQGAALEAKPSLDKGALQGVKERVELETAVGPPMLGLSGMFRNGEGEVMVSFKYDESAKLSRSNEGFQQSGLTSSARVEGGRELELMRDGCTLARSSPVEAKGSDGISADGRVKKTKVPKRPLGDLNSENSALGEKKKKKKKKEPVAEPNSDHPQKTSLASGKGGAAIIIAGKSSQISYVAKEDSGVYLQKKGVGSNNYLMNSAGTSVTAGVGNIALELPQLLRDLQDLALDPFHGVHRSRPETIRLFFLRFRSLVYQKSLVLSPPSECETVEVRATKPLFRFGASDGPTGQSVREITHLKPVKALARPDDPTKAGRKRLPSDRQEEIAAKRLKKINQLKSLAAEKKASQRTVDASKVEGKDQGGVTSSTRPIRPQSVKKMELPARAVEPTMLVMKFPPRTSLPSVAELKARFGRFGSLDQSAIRVFWKSSTCRVVFRHKGDAEAAYKYANGNNSLFGNVSVRYHLREVEVSAPEGSELNKGKGDDASGESLRVREPAAERLAPTLPSQPLAQPTVQLKSCLKKPTGEDAGHVAGGNGGRGTARVKFMLGGEESRGEQLTIGNRNTHNNNASFADAGAPSVAMDFNSKNFQKVISPSPILPLPPQFAKAPLNNLHLTELAPRNSHNRNAQSAPPSMTSIDISQQMLSLLSRCNDVVTNVTGLLGYVPYHPL